MINLRLAIVEHSAELPAMECGNFFHSAALFGIYESTPRMRPLMVVASDGAGRVLAHLLAVVRRRSWALPPFFYSHCIVLGEGEYAAGADREALFGRMLAALTRRLQGRVLYIEFSHLGSKMFGYAKFRGSRRKGSARGCVGALKGCAEGMWLRQRWQARPTWRLSAICLNATTG